MQAAEPQVRLRTSRPSLRDGLNGLYVLSPGNGSVAPVIALRVRAPRFSASTAAPRPHDFAVRTGSFVRMDNHAATRCAHRIPRSTSVTIAIRPCNEAGCAGVNHDFQKNTRRIFLRRELDRAPKSSGPKRSSQQPFNRPSLSVIARSRRRRSNPVFLSASGLLRFARNEEENDFGTWVGKTGSQSRGGNSSMSWSPRRIADRRSWATISEIHWTRAGRASDFACRRSSGRSRSWAVPTLMWRRS
jgi:hypothetical protein